MSFLTILRNLASRVIQPFPPDTNTESNTVEMDSKDVFLKYFPKRNKPINPNSLFRIEKVYNEAWDMVNYLASASSPVSNAVSRDLLTVHTTTNTNYQLAHNQYGNFCTRGIKYTLAYLNLSKESTYTTDTIATSEIFSKMREAIEKETIASGDSITYIIPRYWILFIVLQLWLEYDISMEKWIEYVDYRNATFMGSRFVPLVYLEYEVLSSRNTSWFDVSSTKSSVIDLNELEEDA